VGANGRRLIFKHLFESSFPQKNHLVLPLLLEFVKFPPLALQLGLIGIDLFLLIRLSDVLSLQLIAHQSAGAETESAADRRAGARMPNRGPDDPTGCSAAESADPRTLFAGRETAPGASDCRQKHHTKQYGKSSIHHPS
jgi:hypothetical protein